MTKLSIIIVNYNVQYFLEQCLLSVQKAMTGMTVEVFVVDNNSVDGSVQMVQEKFPWVKCIANKDNTGFSKANNQAMRVAEGEYFLLLNPDTVIEEDTLKKVVDFMDAHPDAGGLGVNMVDGKGKFLPESKRGLPTPETSFYKIFGINKLFPSSKKFNRYYLGHLSNDEVNEIEILSGAFMLMRKKALDKVGLLDEAFFMYGEDIDLSWRIIQGGYKNYYFPETRIIHYKGESTKKGSLNYVFVFYNAMVIFAKKHFSESNARTFSFFIQMAIWLRASVAVLNRFIKSAALPLFDVAAILGFMYAALNFYSNITQIIYESKLVYPAFIVFSAVWIFSSWLGGAFDKPHTPLKVLKPSLIGAFVILVGYSLLPESMRFSRAVVLMSCIAAPLLFMLTHTVANLISSGKSGWKKNAARSFAIVGNADEIDRVSIIIQQTYLNIGTIVKINTGNSTEANFDGNLSQLSEIVRIWKLNSVIFCAKDVTSSDIIGTMSSMESDDIEFKIAPPETLYIIGSNSIDTSGDVYILDVNSIAKSNNQRVKRTFDIAASLVMLIALPIIALAQQKPIGFLSNLVQVFIGKKSWVGFCAGKDSASFKLPKIKSGVLHPLSHLAPTQRTEENIQKLNIVYAKDYKVSTDLAILVKSWRELG